MTRALPLRLCIPSWRVNGQHYLHHEEIIFNSQEIATLVLELTSSDTKQVQKCHVWYLSQRCVLRNMEIFKLQLYGCA